MTHWPLSFHSWSLKCLLSFVFTQNVLFLKYQWEGFFSLSLCCRFIIYKLPRYKIGEVGSGVDYMYLDSSVGSWQMSKFMVNTSQGAIGNTLNQLYMGEAYKVRLCPCSPTYADSGARDYRDPCGSYIAFNRIDTRFFLWRTFVAAKLKIFGNVGDKLASTARKINNTALPRAIHFVVHVIPDFLRGEKKVYFSIYYMYKTNISLSLRAQSTHSTMMHHQSWITSKDMDTLKVQ